MHSPITVIVGLGNPGPEYAHTYHNAGVLALGHLRMMFKDLTPQKSSSASLYTYERLGPYILITPKTFMNEAGEAVRKALIALKKNPDELLVIHDETDLPLGKARIDFGRGAAGHRGVASVIERLGTKDFWRLRLGVRKETGLPAETSAAEGARRVKAGDFVLRSMSKADEAAIYLASDGAIKKLIENDTP